MGNHRAERSDTRNGPSVTPPGSSPETYVGRRVASRPVDAPLAARVVVPTVLPAPVPVQTAASYDPDATTQLPRVVAAGKRKAERHVGSRGPLFKGLPSAPVLLGVATLAVAVTCTLTAGNGGPQLSSAHSSVAPATALSGSSGVGSVDSSRGTSDLSRDFDRDSPEPANDVQAAESVAADRTAALSQLTSEASKQAKKLNDDRWVVPLHPVVLTARFGEYGLWSSMHTGLDFNGETGDPIHAIAAGVVTFVGYDGSYGNKTVVTLPDGTELWYCHQTTQYVSAGDNVTPDEVIGTVGTTGHVTGSHLHVEVRPGGGDPVDPYAAFVQHGVVPEEG